jgi:hypothetical protein
MNADDVRLVQEEEKRAKEWKCQLPFNIINNPEFESVINLVDYVGDGKFTCKTGQIISSISVFLLI